MTTQRNETFKISISSTRKRPEQIVYFQVLGSNATESVLPTVAAGFTIIHWLKFGRERIPKSCEICSTIRDAHVDDRL